MLREAGNVLPLHLIYGLLDVVCAIGRMWVEGHTLALNRCSFDFGDLPQLPGEIARSGQLQPVIVLSVIDDI